MRLFIHVGHSKTGSSFIQSSLAKHSHYLSQQDIFYPVLPSEVDNTGITSGNGSLLEGILPKPPQGTKSYVLSSEQLFQKILANDGFEESLRRGVAQIGASSVTFIIFVRDPIDHAESAYQQQVKRGGDTIDVERFFDSYNMPKLVPRFFKCIKDYASSSIVAFNYSKHSREVVDCVLTTVGADIPQEMLDRGDCVNRSMTRAELALQRAFNSHLGKGGSVLSDALCNALPSIKSDKIFPSVEVQQKMLDRLASTLDEVDRLLPEFEAYGREVRDPIDDSAGYLFSQEQLELIGDTLSKKIGALQEELYFTKARSYLRECSMDITAKERSKLLDLAKRQLKALVSLPYTSSLRGQKIARLQDRADSFELTESQGE